MRLQYRRGGSIVRGMETTTEIPQHKVTIVGPNLINQQNGTFEVHGTGCRSTYRNINGPEDGMDCTVASQLDVAEFIYEDHACDENEPNSPEYWDYLRDTVNDFHFHACCKDLPAEVEVSS